MSNKSDLAKSILGEAAGADKAPAQAPVVKPPAAPEPEIDEVEAAFKKGPVLVKALEKGMYPNGRRRKLGEVFKVEKLQHFSKRWMQLVK